MSRWQGWKAGRARYEAQSKTERSQMWDRTYPRGNLNEKVSQPDFIRQNPAAVTGFSCVRKANTFCNIFSKHKNNCKHEIGLLRTHNSHLSSAQLSSTSTWLKQHAKPDISRPRWKGTDANLLLSPLTRDPLNIFPAFFFFIFLNSCWVPTGEKPVPYFQFWLIDLKQPYFPSVQTERLT